MSQLLDSKNYNSHHDHDIISIIDPTGSIFIQVRNKMDDVTKAVGESTNHPGYVILLRRTSQIVFFVEQFF